jgi:acetyl esterase/lipase
MRAVTLFATILSSVPLFAQTGVERPAPTFQDVRYGPHERNVLDLFQAEGAGPRPLAVYIHGGGFRGGSKEGINARALNELLAAGVSVAAIHYRFVQQAPLPAAHEDSRAALQFLRSKAAEWNLDKTRVGAFGGSAGAQICMWLAYHGDMAKPDSVDPLERESTRLTAVAPGSGQTTMDFEWWKANIPGYVKPHRPMEEYFGDSERQRVLPVIREISALDLASADDPPTFMTYAMAPDDAIPEGDKASGWQVHHVNFGLALKEKLDAAGVEAVVQYPGKRSQYGSAAGFLAAKLTR